MLCDNGKLYKTTYPKAKEIKPDKRHCFKLRNDNNKIIEISLKSIYRKVYHKEYCTDTIQDLPQEVWKPIPDTEGKYFVSNCGRVKSLCRYKAQILKTYKLHRGYLAV